MNTHFTKEEKGQQTLLFLHGWGCCGSIFLPVAKKLNYTSVLLDLWGFGKSQSPPEDGFSVEDYADQLKEFCVRESLNKFSIVCHSFGCRVALVFCAKYPDFCNSLIITGGAGLRRFSLKKWLKIKRYKLCKWCVKKKLLRQKCLEKFGSSDLKAIGTESMKNTFLKAVNQDLSSFAKNVRCKTLLIYGKNDKDTPLWIGKKLNKLVADSFLIELSGGHFLFLENPARFAAIVDSYLKGV